MTLMDFLLLCMRILNIFDYDDYDYDYDDDVQLESKSSSTL